MEKKLKINPTILSEMGLNWIIEVSEKPFSQGKAANMPALGYPCALCASKDAKLRFAKSTEEEDSNLEWMELQCKSCKKYSLYTKK